MAERSPSPPLYGYEGPAPLSAAAPQVQGWRGRLSQAIHNAGASADRALSYYAGPHVMGAARKLSDLATMVSPGADMIDARENYAGAIDAAREGDVQGAVGNAGWGLLSNMGLSELAGPAKAIFAGVGAKTADMARLRAAEEAEQAGADATQIWNDTGWFRGADGEWRFEIDDSASVWRGHKPGKKNTYAREYLAHDDLYSAYPGMGAIAVSDRPGEYGAGYNTTHDVIGVGSKAENPKQSTIHELQHAVDNREDFTQGVSPFAPNAPKVDGDKAKKLETDIQRVSTRRALIQSNFDRRPGEAAYYVPLLESADAELAALTRAQEEAARLDHYWLQADEVQARNAERRMNMTPEQRKATPPWTTEDVPRDRQIVRMTDRDVVNALGLRK